jgi:hypothetical protein
MGATENHDIVARLCAISEQRKTPICDRVVHFEAPEDTTLGSGVPLRTHRNIHFQGEEGADSQRSPHLYHIM